MTGREVEAVYDEVLRVLGQPSVEPVDGQLDGFPLLELEQPAPGGQASLFGGDAPDEWQCPVYVCSTCGVPTESEPCREHQPAAWAEFQQ